MKIFASLTFAALINCASPVASADLLRFSVPDGRILNEFYRAGPVAAHVALTSGSQARLVVAFPAGNSGVGLWFQTTESSTDWKLATPPRPVTRLDARRRPLHGIEFVIETPAPELRVRGAVLSSVRVLRDYELQEKAPPEVLVAPQATTGAIEWARDRLDGAPGYRLAFEALDGSHQADAALLDQVRLVQHAVVVAARQPHDQAHVALHEASLRALLGAARSGDAS